MCAASNKKAAQIFEIIICLPKAATFFTEEGFPYPISLSS